MSNAETETGGAPMAPGDTGGAPLSGENPAGHDEAGSMQGQPFGVDNIGSGMDWDRER